jgi:hypothetical protein
MASSCHVLPGVCVEVVFHSETAPISKLLVCGGVAATCAGDTVPSFCLSIQQAVSPRNDLLPGAPVFPGWLRHFASNAHQRALP